MAQLIHFEEKAVARLRERLGLAEEANEDLIAFARGHSGAVASIHSAVLAAVEAPSVERLLEVVVHQWPQILAIDAAAVGVLIGDLGFRADCSGIERVETAFVARMLAQSPRVEVRSVDSGHPLFGRAWSGRVRAEALIPIASDPPYPQGLLVLGQEAELALDSSHGSELLVFLGQMLAATFRRFVAIA